MSCDFSVGLVEGVLYVLFFEFSELRVGEYCCVVSDCCLRRCVRGIFGGFGCVEGEDAVLGGDGCAFHNVLEFADVSGPVVCLEGHCVALFESGCIDSESFGGLLEKVCCENGDVFGSFAQGGRLNGEDAQAEVEVLSKAVFFCFRFQAAVGCGDDAYVDGSGCFVSDAFEFSFLYNAEELSL